MKQAYKDKLFVG